MPHACCYAGVPVRMPVAVPAASQNVLVSIPRLQTQEADLEKAQQKARAQQELIEELKKRKAVQYELISSSQQLLELRDKVYEQE
eukprot:Skav225809  [mRNA]  locus=scaffold4730:7400:8995:- [translate_table: standard]